MVPVVVGPGRRALSHRPPSPRARACTTAGVDSVFVTVVADFSKLDSPRYFWNMMDFHGWTHPFDGKGRRRDYADLPRDLSKAEDDPYRSLAGELRTIGGYAKDSPPFSEFVWADFLRRRIKPKHAAQGLFAARSAQPSASPSRRTRATFPAGAGRTPRRSSARGEPRSATKRRTPRQGPPTEGLRPRGAPRRRGETIRPRASADIAEKQYLTPNYR